MVRAATVCQYSIVWDLILALAKVPAGAALPCLAINLQHRCLSQTERKYWFRSFYSAKLWNFFNFVVFSFNSDILSTTVCHNKISLFLMSDVVAQSQHLSWIWFGLVQLAVPDQIASPLWIWNIKSHQHSYSWYSSWIILAQTTSPSFYMELECIRHSDPPYTALAAFSKPA